MWHFAQKKKMSDQTWVKKSNILYFKMDLVLFFVNLSSSKMY